MNKNTIPIKILVIDDDAAIRDSFADYLEDRDFDVVTAENGRIGLELIEQEHLCVKTVVIACKTLRCGDSSFGGSHTSLCRTLFVCEVYVRWVIGIMSSVEFQWSHFRE